MEIILKENERIDDLEYKNLKIIQNKKWFCFGIDSILLADFAKDIKKGSIVMDLGTGTGIISILLCGKTNLKKVIGVEVQSNVCEMASRSIKLNDLQEKFEVINYNIKDIMKVYSKNSFDAIVTNPPYKKINTGITNENMTKLISRHEKEANLEDFLSIASSLLKNKGVFYMVHRPERLVDIIFLLRKYRLEPKFIKFVRAYEDSEPNLLLIKCIKCGKPFLKLDKILTVYNKNGEYTKEILKIYGKEN